MVSLMENEGRIDNRKTVITFSFGDFSAPSERRMFIFWLFHQFTTPLYTYTVLALVHHGLI